jgi:hypothetical protein
VTGAACEAAASVVAAFAIAACAARAPAGGALARVDALAGRPVHVTVADGRVLAFDSARVVGDSLLGFTAGRERPARVAVHVADVGAARPADDAPDAGRSSLVRLLVGIVLGVAAWWYVVRVIGGG